MQLTERKSALALGALCVYAALALLFSANSPAETISYDANAVDPVVSVAGHSRCSSRTVVITPSYVGGQLLRSVLYVNGRHVQTLTDSGAVFSSGVRRFKGGRNNYEIVSLFSSGKSASTIGYFTRCTRRG